MGWEQISKRGAVRLENRESDPDFRRFKLFCRRQFPIRSFRRLNRKMRRRLKESSQKIYLDLLVLLLQCPL